MSNENSVVLTLQDQVSAGLKSIMQTNKGFSKDLEESGKRLEALQKGQETYNTQLSKAQVHVAEMKKALIDANKAFREQNDELSKSNLEKAYEDYNNAQEAVKGWRNEIKAANKEMQELSDQQQRSDNRTGEAWGKAKAGLGQMLGNSLSSAAGTLVSSAVGDTMGNAISTTLSSTLSGAMTGSIAGLPGALVGGAVGLISGIVTAGAQAFEKKDKVFKSVRDDLVNSANQSQAEALARGTGIAGTREQNKILFSTMLGGDRAAESFLSELVDYAEATPFSYSDLTNIGKTLFAYGYNPGDLTGNNGLLTKVGDAGSALGMSSGDMTLIATSLGRMQVTDKAALEYLNPLLERGIPVIDYLAEGFGVAKDEVYDLVSKGLIPGAEAAECIADYMGVAFSGNMEKQSQTYLGLLSTLEDLQEGMDAARGEGFNEKRKEGLIAQNEYMGGEGGERMQEANRLIGEWEASLENTKEQINREVYDAVMGGNFNALKDSGAYEYSDNETKRLSDLNKEYQKAMAEENGAEAGRIMKQAQIEAEMLYNASDGFQQELEMQKQLIQNVTAALVKDDTYWNASYELGQLMSQGMMAGMMAGVEENFWDKFINALGIDVLTTEPGGKVTSLSKFRGVFSRAMGVPYVPYDNYPILAHRGEQLLTASEARSGSGGNGSPIIVNVNGTVREEADIDKIARAVVGEIIRVQPITVS